MKSRPSNNLWPLLEVETSSGVPQTARNFRIILISMRSRPLNGDMNSFLCETVERGMLSGISLERMLQHATLARWTLSSLRVGTRTGSDCNWTAFIWAFAFCFRKLVLAFRLHRKPTQFRMSQKDDQTRSDDS